MKKLLLILLCLPMIGFGQEDYHALAEEAMKSKNYELALEYYNKANMEEIESKKWCCMKMDSEDEHKTEYQGNPDTYLSMAMLYVQANDLEIAIQSTTAFIELFTLDDEALSMMYFIRGLAWSNLLVNPRYSERIKQIADYKEIGLKNICYNMQMSCSMGYKEACDWPYDDCK